MDTISPTKSTNYGVFTDISKGINLVLGDETGRTVSRRTAQGFKEVTDKNDLSDETAEFIVHLGMVSSLVLILSLTPKNKQALVVWIVLILILLFVFYHAGARKKTISAIIRRS